MKKKSVIKLVISAAVLIIAYIAGTASGIIKAENIQTAFSFDAAKLLELCVMIPGVLLIKNAVVLILGLFHPKNHRARSVISIISSVLSYIAFIVILCLGLTIIGVNMTAVIASVGVLALIVGFSAESLIADVVTGTFMLLENQYNVGDIVEVNGFRGKVTSIGIRTTCITDSGDNVKIINNSEMKNILNRSDNSSRAVSDISIPYETDIKKLEEKLPVLTKEIFEENSSVFKAEPQYLGIQELGDSGVVLRFVVEVSEKDIFSATRILNRALLLGFKNLGVECPYPQLDVHQK